MDDEPLLVEALTSQIRLQSDIVVHSTTSPAEVVDLVVRHDPHVVVSDVRMPELSGIDVVGAVRRVRTNLPFVLMTAFSVTEVRAQTSVMPSLSFLQKPFEVSQLIELVDSLRSRSDDGRFSGVVAIESLTDVVQLYVLSNTCGLLEVRRREKVGRIWIDRGAILHAEHDEQQGTDALFDILSWKGGSFALSMGVRAPTRTIFETATTLMLESCRRQDEATAMRTPQDTSTRSGWSWHPAPGDSIDSAWDTNLFSDDAPSIQAGPPIQQKETTMANVNEVLAKFGELDGFIAATLVDSESGMMLGAEGGDRFNVEVAAAGNSEVVKAKRRVAKSLNLKDDIEDILITLGKQYHLIRPLRSKPNVFFYLAVDRTKANLALCRMKVAELEKEVAF